MSKSNVLLGAAAALLGFVGLAGAQEQPPPPAGGSQSSTSGQAQTGGQSQTSGQAQAGGQVGGQAQAGGQTGGQVQAGGQVGGRTGQVQAGGQVQTGRQGTQVEGRVGTQTGGQVEGRVQTGRRDTQVTREGVQVEGQVREGQVGTRTDVTRQDVEVQGQVQSRSASARAAGSYHRAKQVLGARVSIDGGLAVGTVDDIVFADDGMIEFLVVNNEGKLVSVPWAAARFNFEQRTATVAITQERFQQIPTFTAENFPRFDEQYRTRTYSFYNVPVPQGRVGVGAGVNTTPRQERRIDRAEQKLDRAIDKANRRP